MVGIDPGPFSLRELVWMAEGRRRDEWSRTAQILATLYNLVRDPKKRRKPWTAAELDPTVTEKPKRKPTGFAGFLAMKQAFPEST